MIKNKYISLIVQVLLYTLVLASCIGEDRRLDYLETTSANDSIYNTMMKNYLWYNKIPSHDKLNLYADQDVFFYTLLADSEKKSNNFYSYIEKKQIATKSIDESYSYGFEFQSYTTDSTWYARVLYVLPGSPAKDAGLKRGDWILSVNDQKISKTNYTNLYSGSGAKLILGSYTGNTKKPFKQSDTITLSTARAVNNDPILVKETLTSASGGKVGYLVYNQFAIGPNNSTTDNTYENELRQVFASFKSQNVQNFILDLRYNPGGYVTTSQLLSTMLAPATALDKLFCTAKFNDKQTSNSEIYTFNSNLIGSGANLNLGNLYVLVSGVTASASELLINGLKPFMNVKLIGTTTEGKNVGSVAFDLENWIIHPIVCKFFNSLNSSDYARGFTPDVITDETKSYDMYKELGDANELLIKEALALINGASIPKAASTRSVSTGLNIGISSLDRKRTNGVWLVPGRTW